MGGMCICLRTCMRHRDNSLLNELRIDESSLSPVSNEPISRSLAWMDSLAVY